VWMDIYDTEANAHSKHTFVMKKNVSDTWIPAIREDQRRSAISADLISDLEGRELSTNDYDLLLQLDQAERYPLQDFLLSVLGGERIAVEDAKAFGDASGQCILCSQTLRMLAALRVLPCGVRCNFSTLCSSMKCRANALSMVTVLALVPRKLRLPLHPCAAVFVPRSKLRVRPLPWTASPFNQIGTKGL